MHRLSLALLLLSVAVALAQQNCDGVYNGRPIYANEPQLLQTVPNGKVYAVGTGAAGTTLRVAHLYGTPYQMGMAQGQLFGAEIKAMLANFYAYLDAEINPYVKWLPKEVQEALEEYGIDAALQVEVDLLKKWITDDYMQEVQGMADGMKNNITADELMRVNVFPEIIRASCSMYGAWGAALANSNSQLLQLRALDWGTDNPFVPHSLVTVYHPAEGYGHAFATLGFTGFIGSITAYSQHLGLSEKVWDAYNGTYSPEGVPWHFLMRDGAQYDTNIDAFLNRVINSPRTCAIHLGVGSISDKQFRVVEYSHDGVTIYDDQNFPAYEPAHPQLDGVVYLDKHVQPSQNPCLGSLMAKYYGQYTPELTIRNISAVHASGDMHAAVYDYSNNMMFASIAGPNVADNGTVLPGNTTWPAYARPWFRINMTEALGLTY